MHRPLGLLPADAPLSGKKQASCTYLAVPCRFMQGITTVLVAALLNAALLPLLTLAQQLQSAQASSGAGNSGRQQPEAVARRTTDL